MNELSVNKRRLTIAYKQKNASKFYDAVRNAVKGAKEHSNNYYCNVDCQVG